MNKLFIFVEGKDDKKFVNEILVPIFYKNSTTVITIPYQIKKNKDIDKQIIRCLKSNNTSYVFLSDLDSHTYPCITSRKNKRKEEYNSLDEKNIIIVKEEIENWYLAGTDTSISQFKDFTIGETTDNITKEDLEKMILKSKFDSRIDFFSEVAKNYNLDLAVKRNASSRYFIERFNLNS